ncbi:glutamate receptor 2.1-like isoform X1 [Magnolia sinica]|uniref:glutamate receptor 2.1-like isoform X1 n=1 Tax=Magnolia sinica TaxID=86752 RepID=UPI00265ABBA6|nr:glutamate receptor 2.1-like isoform X1 [Magnolia sinica]
MNGQTHLHSTFIFFIIGFCTLRCCRELEAAQNTSHGVAATLNVGVILDLDTWVGKMSESCISMAVDDFYASHDNYTTRLALHTRNSQKDVVVAAAAAVDLLKNVQAHAIIGPQKSAAAEFVVDLGEKAHVPIISFSATSPSLSSTQTPYFVRTAQNDASHVKAIAAIIQAFGWRRAVLIYEDTDYGHGVIPYLTDALEEVNTQVPFRSIIPLSASDAQMLEELYKLKTMQTRVFVVHISSNLASRFFPMVSKAEMMREGYVWIITDGLTDLLDSLDSSVIDLMQGVLGVKPYVERTKELDDFTARWRKKFRRENPEIETFELSNFGLWAYDTVWALAMAAEQVGTVSSPFQELNNDKKTTDLATLGVSQVGSKLLDAILKIQFKGLSGEFQLVDGQSQSSAFQIVNVIGKGERSIGFWTPTYGISRTMNVDPLRTYSASMVDMRAIIWPGELASIPKGWVVPTSTATKMRIGVPVKDGFHEYVKVERDSQTNTTSVTGFFIDVFKAVVESLPYALSYDFIPFEGADGHMAGTYDDLIYQVYLQKYDAVIGDVTITANRSLYVDFTLPYVDSGVSMVAPFTNDRKMNAWIFLKPLSMGLWVTSGASFIFIGLVVWVLEHRINEDFRGPPSKQISTILWFSFSTLVFAHREKVVSNLSRGVMIIWLFVVLILTSSYTASLTSMLTVQRLKPTVTTVGELLKNGDNVGYQKNSFVYGLLKSWNFDDSRIRGYNTSEEYDEALSNGTSNGGVSAIFREVPYVNILAKYCNKYALVGPINKTGGFGFVFPKGSPLVSDISRAILNVTEGEKMVGIEKAWFGGDAACLHQVTTITSNSLSLHTFGGLFIITGVASVAVFIIFIAHFLYQNRDVLAAANPQMSIWKRLAKLAERFDQEDRSPSVSQDTETSHGQETNYGGDQSPASIHDIDVSPRESIFSNHTYESSIEEEGGPSTEELVIKTSEPSFKEFLNRNEDVAT